MRRSPPSQITNGDHSNVARHSMPPHPTTPVERQPRPTSEFVTPGDQGAYSKTQSLGRNETLEGKSEKKKRGGFSSIFKKKHREKDPK